MWRADGSPGNNQPLQWWRQDSTQELVGIHGIDVRQEHINHTFRGGTTGTWVIPNLAIAYAKYLSPHFHAWANQGVIERISELISWLEERLGRANSGYAGR